MNKSSFTVTPAGPLSVGDDQSNMYSANATIVDTNGAPIPDQTVTFGASPINYGFPKFVSGATCATTSEGTCSVTLFSHVAGTTTISAGVPGGSLHYQGLAAQSVGRSWRAGPVCVATPQTTCQPLDGKSFTTVEVIKDNALPNGQDQDMAKVWAYDQYGNPVANAPITASDANGQMAVTAGPTGPDGTSLITYTATAEGSYQSDLTIDDQTPLQSPITLTFTEKATNLVVKVKYPTRLPGASQVVTGDGFQPGERICGNMAPDNADIECMFADQSGHIEFSFIVPSDAQLGDHTVTLIADHSGSASATFAVVGFGNGSVVATGGTVVHSLAGPLGLVAAGILIVVGVLLVVRQRRHMRYQR